VGVHLEIILDALVPVIPAYGQQVDPSVLENALELPDRLLLVGILSQ
jgi:hypothetical protein